MNLVRAATWVALFVVAAAVVPQRYQMFKRQLMTQYTFHFFAAYCGAAAHCEAVRSYHYEVSELEVAVDATTGTVQPHLLNFSAAAILFFADSGVQILPSNDTLEVTVVDWYGAFTGNSNSVTGPYYLPKQVVVKDISHNSYYNITITSLDALEVDQYKLDILNRSNAAKKRFQQLAYPIYSYKKSLVCPVCFGMTVNYYVNVVGATVVSAVDELSNEVLLEPQALAPFLSMQELFDVATKSLLLVHRAPVDFDADAGMVSKFGDVIIEPPPMAGWVPPAPSAVEGSYFAVSELRPVHYLGPQTIPEVQIADSTVVAVTLTLILLAGCGATAV